MQERIGHGGDGKECPGQVERLSGAGYEFVGKSAHSAVKVCLWVKNSLVGAGSCYKNKFYGIQSERCVQFSPSMRACTQKCVFCWRDNSDYGPAWEGAVDEPSEIAKGAIMAQLHQIVGFKGNPKVPREKWERAQKPLHAAVSLSGEPTMYPRIGELIREFHSLGLTTFLVSNGTRPEVLERLERENALPTQLYISLAAFDEISHNEILLPQEGGTWEKFLRSLDYLKNISGKTRTVMRMTVIRGISAGDGAAAGFSELITRGAPDYVEVKGYMHVGPSINRLGREAMPNQEEINGFARKIAERTGYIYTDEHAPSIVTLLCRDDGAKGNRFLKIRG
jgi:tRNA wybutosine-synthesizing protein 1